ncbi:hypothetical protein BH23BAC1_BH23BAC1_48360 [soil metagenome]
MVSKSYILTRRALVFHFAPYEQKEFTLQKHPDGTFSVRGEFEGKTITLERIFIQIDGGTFWVPKISKINVHGYCMYSKKKIISTINPQL